MQPTARSAPSASSATGTEPAVWLRSHSASAPASWASSADLGHVGDVRRAVGDVRERDQRGPLAHRLGHRLGLRAVRRVAAQKHQLEPARLRQPLEHVAVGREVVVVGDDLVAPGAQRRAPPRRACRSRPWSSRRSRPGPGRRRARPRRAGRRSSAAAPSSPRPTRGSAARPTRSATVCARRSTVARGSRPSELPSR